MWWCRWAGTGQERKPEKKCKIKGVGCKVIGILKLKFLHKEDNVISYKNWYFAILGIIMLLPGFLITGCGYAIRAPGDPMGIKMESIAIPMIESTSSDLGFEADFTRVIREEFIRNSKVPLVSREEAQTVLSGRVYDIRTEPVSYDLDQRAVNGAVTTYTETKTRMLRVRVDMKFEDKGTGTVLWRNENMEEKTSYVVDRDPLVTQFNKKKALETIAERLAKRVYLQTMERF
jgi:hypothetical protein